MDAFEESMSELWQQIDDITDTNRKLIQCLRMVFEWFENDWNGVGDPPLDQIKELLNNKGDV